MSVCVWWGVLPASTGTGSLLRVCLGAGEPMWLSGFPWEVRRKDSKLPPQGPWGYESKAVPGGCWWRRMELGVHILASLPSQRVSDSKPWRVGAQTRQEGVWGRVGERSSGCSRATGTGLGETELGKWSGEMPGAEVSAGRPRDSRWPGRGEDGCLARAGGAVRRPSPHLGHPAQGTPLS